jgi:hypothetical protein
LPGSSPRCESRSLPPNLAGTATHPVLLPAAECLNAPCGSSPTRLLRSEEASRSAGPGRPVTVHRLGDPASRWLTMTAMRRGPRRPAARGSSRLRRRRSRVPRRPGPGCENCRGQLLRGIVGEVSQHDDGPSSVRAEAHQVPAGAAMALLAMFARNAEQADNAQGVVAATNLRRMLRTRSNIFSCSSSPCC